jgi:hypothetical protein
VSDLSDIATFAESVPCRPLRSHPVHVLLRHRPRSISPSAAPAYATCAPAYCRPRSFGHWRLSVPISAYIQPYPAPFRRRHIVSRAAFGGVERETATSSLACRRASHARGRWFDPSRAHVGRGSACRPPPNRIIESPGNERLEPRYCAGDVAADGRSRARSPNPARRTRNEATPDPG